MRYVWRVCGGGNLNFFLSVSLPLPPHDVLSVKQTCSDSEGRLLFRLGRRQSSPHFASAATGESLQLTIITLTADNPATHHSQSITPVMKGNLYFQCSVKELRRNRLSLFFPPSTFHLCFRELICECQGLWNHDHTTFKGKKEFTFCFVLWEKNEAPWRSLMLWF